MFESRQDLETWRFLLEVGGTVTKHFLVTRTIRHSFFLKKTCIYIFLYNSSRGRVKLLPLSPFSRVQRFSSCSSCFSDDSLCQCGMYQTCALGEFFFSAHLGLVRPCMLAVALVPLVVWTG